MNTFRRLFKNTILLLTLGVAALALFVGNYMQAPLPIATQTSVIIKKGAGFKGAIAALHEAKIIEYPYLFAAIAVASGNAKKFKAGEYSLTPDTTPLQLIQKMISGDVVIHKLTIAEGLTVKEIITIISAENVLEGDIPANIPEGSLLPETYYFTYGDTKQAVINRMQEAMKEVIDLLWSQRAENLPFTTIKEAITLASIIEKETDMAEERPHIAGVYINRLRKNMRLQADPTVIYGIEKEKGALGRALLSGDLAFDSPYNTYMYVGLPPAPIANPGRAAIEAALNPKETDDLFFVATGTGGHYFAKTLAQHNENVRLYRETIK